MQLKIDHIQIAMPVGGEALARSFYRDVLGLTERSKPIQLATRGGCWFEDVFVKVHLGVDPDFTPARKAHIGFVSDQFEALKKKLENAGLETSEADAIEGAARFFVDDPFGNRLEFLSSAKG